MRGVGVYVKYACTFSLVTRCLGVERHITQLPEVLGRHILTTHSNDNIYFNTPYVNTSRVNMPCVTHTVQTPITLTHIVLCLPRSDTQDNNLHSSGRNVLSKYKLSI